jgi:hypothetical protein
MSGTPAGRSGDNAIVTPAGSTSSKPSLRCTTATGCRSTILMMSVSGGTVSVT